MQGLVVVGLIFEEIPNINIKRVKVTGVHNIGQGHQVKVSVESVHRGEVLYTVDPIYRGAWGPSSATAIYPDRDISWGGSLLRRR